MMRTQNINPAQARTQLTKPQSPPQDKRIKHGVHLEEINLRKRNSNQNKASQLQNRKLSKESKQAQEIYRKELKEEKKLKLLLNVQKH